MNSKLNRVKDVLWVLAMFGLVSLVLRIFFGLGATTNLTDAMPWGLWKIFNMVAGVALATGGFATAAIVYVFHMDKYRSLVKPAIVVAFLGYGVSCFSLMFDIGLPHRIYHPILPWMWNHHSFLFEVAWCVMLYFTISFLELSPTVLEKVPWGEKIAHWLHKYSPPIVIVGITLSSLHHTSLGSLFLVAPGRLHPLWFTGNYLPLQFITSAVGAGMLTVVFVSLTYTYLFNKKADMPALEGFAKASAWILVIFLGLRIAEFTAHGKWGVVFGGQWESYVFYLEILLQVLIPVAIIAVPKWRKSTKGLAAASILAMVGLSMQRLDTGITGFVRWLDTPYWPSIAEFSFTIGIYAAAGLVFIALAQYFDVFEEVKWGAKDEQLEGGLNALWWEAVGSAPVRISLIVIITIPLAIMVFSSNALQGFQLTRQEIVGPTALDKDRHVLNIDGNRNGNGVIFKHEMHKDILSRIVGEENNCSTCHHLSKPADKNTACFHCHTDMAIDQPIFNHAFHEDKLGKKLSGKALCAECHELAEPESLENSKHCYECHASDMGMSTASDGERFNHMAPGYQNAMHELCVNCHVEEVDANPELPKSLGECGTCHNRNSFIENADEPAAPSVVSP